MFRLLATTRSDRSARLPDADGSGSITTLSNPRIGTVRQIEHTDHAYRWEAPSITFEGLADLLDAGVGFVPGVKDMTGLKGRYPVVLEFSLKDAFVAAAAAIEVRDDPAAGANAHMDMQDALMTAFNGPLLKLGLQLEHRKGTVETLIIDHAEKLPSAN